MPMNLYSAVEALTIPRDEDPKDLKIQEELQIRIGHLLRYKETNTPTHLKRALGTDYLVTDILILIYRKLEIKIPKDRTVAILKLADDYYSEICPLCKNGKYIRNIKGLHVIPKEIKDELFYIYKYRSNKDVHKHESDTHDTDKIEEFYCVYLNILLWYYRDWDKGPQKDIIDKTIYREDANVTSQNYIHMYKLSGGISEIKGDVKLMSERNILTKVEKPNNELNWMLIMAVQDNNLILCKDAIENGDADPNTYDKSNGKSALHYAVINKSIEMSEYLLEKGAKPNWRDNSGFTAIDYSLKDINEYVFHYDEDEDYYYLDDCDEPLSIQQIFEEIEGMCDPFEDLINDDDLEKLTVIPELLEKYNAERTQFSIIHYYLNSVKQLTAEMTKREIMSLVVGREEPNIIIEALNAWINKYSKIGFQVNQININKIIEELSLDASYMDIDSIETVEELNVYQNKLQEALANWKIKVFKEFEK